MTRIGLSVRLLPSAVPLLALLLSLGSAGLARADEAITIAQPDARTEIVDITQPTVTQASKTYPSIVFQPGDSVAVNAGGCAQTGGLGSTWKRYVDPSGPNADRLYHGEISVPGATVGLVRLDTVVGTSLQIPANFSGPAGQPLILTLGYEDDGYSDNGYWGHDNGTDDQCGKSDGGDAWLELTITHGAVTTVAKAPFDLAWTQGDANLLPLNPRWGKQDDASEPGLPGTDLCAHPWQTPCTTQQPAIEDLPFPGSPSQPLNALCDTSGPLGHHVNWGVASYEGEARWDGHSTHFDAGVGDFFGADDDYNINVWRTDQSFYTQQNPNDVHTEFDSDETIDHFSEPWWQKFHDAVDNGDPTAMIDGKDVIEIGEVGLDCAHSCGSEIHPVLVLAIHVNPDPADDTWAIFARNTGNEGWCSVDQVVAPELTTVFLSLPAPAGASGVQMTAASVFEKSDNGIGIEPFPVGAANAPTGFGLEIDLGDPNNTPLVDGELHLNWSISAGTPTRGDVTAGQTGLGKVPGEATRGTIASGAGRVGVGGVLGGVGGVQIQPKEVPEPEEVFMDRVAKLSADTQMKVKKLFVGNKLPIPHYIQIKPQILAAAPAAFTARMAPLATLPSIRAVGIVARIGAPAIAGDALDHLHEANLEARIGLGRVALGRAMQVPDQKRIDYYNELAGLVAQ